MLINFKQNTESLIFLLVNKHLLHIQVIMRLSEMIDMKRMDIHILCSVPFTLFS